MFKVILKIAISALLIWWLVGNLNTARIVENMAAADPWGLLMAVVLLSSLTAAQSLRWSLITRAIGKSLRFADAFRIVLIGLFFNQILPSSIGGDAIRIWRTYRLGLGLVPAAHSVMLDRLTALLALILMAGVGLPVIFTLLGDRPERWGVPLLVAGGLGAFGALLLFDRVSGRFMAWRPLRAMAELSVDARRVLLRLTCALPALAISVCIHTCVALTVYIIARSMGLSVQVLDCVILVQPVMLFSMIPISIAGWGVREGAMLTAFSFVGVGADEAFALSVLFGLVIMATGIPGGILWLLSGSKREEDKAGVQVIEEALEPKN